MTPDEANEELAPPATFDDLRALLERHAAGELTLAALQGAIAPLLASDPLDVAESDGAAWEGDADTARLFWRLVYLAESEEEADAGRLARLTPRVFRCLDATGSAADTHELLPLLQDQDRLVAIVARHLAGTISRTGFLSVLAESGYPGHVKLWLEHAAAPHLERFAERLVRGAYGDVVDMVERPPA